MPPRQYLTSVLLEGGTLPGSTGYTYDAAGNRLTKAAVQEASPNPVSVTSNYSYDPIYELTQAVVGGTLAEGYSYDAVGNRLTSAGPTTYNYNTSNELTSDSNASFTHDNNGNTLSKTDSAGTAQYTWDYENRLTQVTLPGQGGAVYFNYDPFGRRIRKSSAGGTIIYAYDGYDVTQQLDGSGNLLASFTQGPGIDEPLAMYRGLGTSYYHADGLGSITALTNGAGQLAASYVYDSFGNLTASTGTVTNPFQYTAREFDPETGLYYYRARYYDPTAGRFLTEDPSAFASDHNFYEYVSNGPTNWVDPFGLSKKKLLKTNEKACVDFDALASCLQTQFVQFHLQLLKFSPTIGTGHNIPGDVNGSATVIYNGNTVATITNDIISKTRADAPHRSTEYVNPDFPPGAFIPGWTDPANPYTNYTVNGTVGQAAMDTQIWELGNSLSVILGTLPSVLEDPAHDPGADTLRCYLKKVGREKDSPR